ncbi:MAG: UDP-N-acetylmuramyl-tripeptide synthetase [Treponema sp.]|nr:UDP-N-acetylmuramyl-tripeptide synthetase [Treponema sp.]
MKKSFKSLLSCFEHEIVDSDGETPLSADEAEKLASSAEIESLVFDSRDVKPGALFFALPGTHTTGNRFIASAIDSGARAIVFQDSFSEEEKSKISTAAKNAGGNVVFAKVKDSRHAMSPAASAFYDNPSSKLVVYGVTGTEGKSSTVAFIWQLLKLSGIKAGFISTVQYSLGGDAVDNPQHQTTPEAPIVQRQLYEMLENKCTHAVVESSSHGLSPRTNRLGDVEFDCGIFMNVTLEHLEFHGTYEQYRDDKANLFRALDKYGHEKTIGGKKQTVPSFGIVNLEDPAYSYFAGATKKPVLGFTSLGKAGRNAEGTGNQNLPEINPEIPYMEASGISSTESTLSFNVKFMDGKKGISNDIFIEENAEIKSNLPGAFNAYNIMATLLAVSGTCGISMEKLVPLVEKITPVKGRMTEIHEGQPFEVIVDYAHTPSSFQTIFPPVRNRCKGRMICLFGSGGERDLTKRPLQGEIAAQFCDTVILTDEDPRGEDSMELLEMIAKGARKNGKIDGKDLFMIPDRPKAIRTAFSMAGENDIVLLLGKAHENSIIYKDHTMKYDEISEAKKAISEMGFKK